MFIRVDGDDEHIEIKEELRLQEEARIEEEVEEEPNLSRDEWGDICPEFMGLKEEVDNMPFSRCGRGLNMQSSQAFSFNTTRFISMSPPPEIPPPESDCTETEQEQLPLMEFNLYDEDGEESVRHS